MSGLAPSPAVAPSNLKRHPGLALLVISCAQLMIILDATIVNVALPTIHRSLHFSPASLEWLITAYSLTFGGLLLFGGRTGDLYGKRKMFMVGIALFAGASLLGGLATDQTWLIITRGLRRASAGRSRRRPRSRSWRSTSPRVPSATGPWGCTRPCPAPAARSGSCSAAS